MAKMLEDVIKKIKVCVEILFIQAANLSVLSVIKFELFTEIFLPEKPP